MERVDFSFVQFLAAQPRFSDRFSGNCARDGFYRVFFFLLAILSVWEMLCS